jgi:hypothetical protein
MKRRIGWIGGGSLAALVLAVGVLVLVAWLRVPTIPASVTKDFAYYTTHFTDPRVRGCLSPRERLDLQRSRASKQRLMREFDRDPHIQFRHIQSQILFEGTTQGLRLGSWTDTLFVKEVACMKQRLRG